MSKEAMKLALAALGLVEGDIEWQERSMTRKVVLKAIDALQKALTEQPAQRTWVGLTDDERVSVLFDVDGRVLDYENYAEAIEAKLKEKNT